MAETVTKSPEQIALETRAADLRTIIANLPASSPLLARKKAHLKTVEAELAALGAK